MHHWMFSSILFLYPLDVSSTLPFVTTKMSPVIAKCPLGGENALLEKHWVILNISSYFFFFFSSKVFYFHYLPEADFLMLTVTSVGSTKN